MAVLALLLGACGSGGARSAVPAGVEVLTEDDLEAAGIPELSSVVTEGLPSFGAGGKIVAASAACRRTETLDVERFSEVHGLASLPDGFSAPFVPGVSDVLLGWILYRVDEAPEERLRDIEIHCTLTAGTRLFLAVGNFTTGRWEPAPRVTEAGFGTEGHTLRLSPSQQYVRSDGAAFLLFALANPGGDAPMESRVRLQSCTIGSHRTDCLRQGFAMGVAGSVDWRPTEIELITLSAARIRHEFGKGPACAGSHLVLAQQLDLQAADVYYAYQRLAVGEVNGDGLEIAWFDPSELHGARYAYRLSHDFGGGPHAVSLGAAAPLPDGGHGIIAILVGMSRAPLPGASCELRVAGAGGMTQCTRLTDPMGVLHMPTTTPGDYVLRVLHPDVDPTGVREFNVRVFEQGGNSYYEFLP
jgi:hypothetical protein